MKCNHDHNEQMCHECASAVYENLNPEPTEPTEETWLIEEEKRGEEHDRRLFERVEN